MTKLSFKFLRKEIEDLIGHQLCQELLKFATKNLSTQLLWGDHKEKKKFPNFVLLVCVYKDLKGLGYENLKNRIASSYHVSKESLIHNVRAAKRCLHKFLVQKAL